MAQKTYAFGGRSYQIECFEEVGQFFSELGGYELAGTIPHPASDAVHGLYLPVGR